MIRLFMAVGGALIIFGAQMFMKGPSGALVDQNFKLAEERRELVTMLEGTGEISAIQLSEEAKSQLRLRIEEIDGVKPLWYQDHYVKASSCLIGGLFLLLVARRSFPMDEAPRRR